MKRNITATCTVLLLGLLVVLTFFSDTLAGERVGSDDRAVAMAESHGAEPVAFLPYELPEDAERWLFLLQGGFGIALLAMALRRVKPSSKSSDR